MREAGGSGRRIEFGAYAVVRLNLNVLARRQEASDQWPQNQRNGRPDPQHLKRNG